MQSIQVHENRGADSVIVFCKVSALDGQGQEKISPVCRFRVAFSPTVSVPSPLSGTVPESLESPR